MPFTWQISINKKSGGGFSYDPNPLKDVAIGDEIIWTNNDDKAHWPGTSSDQAAFMANQIAPQSPSTTFIPTESGPVSYIDSLDKTAPGGTFIVN
jgi:plastocyanin